MAKLAGLLKKKDKTVEPNLGEIEKLAYQFFVERGCEHGHDREDWLRAEALIKNRKA